MNKERINDLVDILGDEYAQLENTFVIKNNEQLAKYLDNPSEWLEQQRADRNRYKRILVKEAKAQLKQLNAKTDKVFLLSYREVAKDHIEITEKEIIAKNIPQEVREQIKQLKDFNAQQITELANQTLTTISRQVQIINATSTADTLYNAVKQQMQKGIQNGVRVMYSNGRQVSWKAYMEMNIRTTIHQEIANDQLNYGASIGQIFYMCDSFADCAHDHAKYQGKLYYNNKVQIPVEIGKFIQQKGIMSMQEVMENDPWLTTRPNCRHNFHAVPLDEALGMSYKKILDKYKLSNGKYENSNYEKLQKQRYNERMIRKYKLRKESDDRLANALGDSSLKTRNNNNYLISKWQKANRELIKKSDGLLHRDYDRENAKVITQDLGVRYDYTFKNGVIEKK